MSDLFQLHGRRAFVTGSSRGIGAAIALGLAEAGADVAIHSVHVDDGAAEAVAEKAAALGVKAIVVCGDLGAEENPHALHQAVIAGLGQVDILVLNASIQIPKDWTGISRDDFHQQVTINYRSSLELLQLCLPPMAERKWGRVLSIGSVQELVPNPDMLVYSSLKTAQTALVTSLAKPYAAHGITLNNLAPGVIETDRYRSRVTTPEQAEHVLGWIPAGHIGQPADCVGPALLLCSDAGRYLTGQTLFADGGMSL